MQKCYIRIARAIDWMLELRVECTNDIGSRGSEISKEIFLH